MTSFSEDVRGTTSLASLRVVWGRTYGSSLGWPGTHGVARGLEVEVLPESPF